MRRFPLFFFSAEGGRRSRWILTGHPHFVVVCGAAFVAALRRESMSLMSGAVYLYAELVATVRESRRPFRDSGLCGERMRRPVLPAVGEKASGRGCRVVSFDRSLGLRRSGRSFSLSGPFCPFDLLEPVVRTVSSDRNRSGVFVGRDGVFA